MVNKEQVAVRANSSRAHTGKSADIVVRTLTHEPGVKRPHPDTTPCLNIGHTSHKGRLGIKGPSLVIWLCVCLY